VVARANVLLEVLMIRDDLLEFSSDFYWNILKWTIVLSHMSNRPDMLVDLHSFTLSLFKVFLNVVHYVRRFL